MDDCTATTTEKDSINKEINKNVSPEYEEFIRNNVQVYLNSLEQKRKPQPETISSISYTREIRCLMRVFGDCKKPLWESVLYVEKILRQQINLLLTKAAAVTTLRNGEMIEHDDLLFLLRKKHAKLKLLLQYLSIKDSKELLKRSKIRKEVPNPANGKRVKCCLEFLDKIDNFLEYRSLLETNFESEPVVHARNLRRYTMVQKMKDAEYLDFFNLLQVTLLPLGKEKIFMNYLLADGVTNLKLSMLAVEIANYFARDIICTIVDLVMDLRNENIASGEEQKTTLEPTQPKEEIDLSKCEEGCSKMDTDDSSKEQEECNPITPSEIREAICRYAKDQTQKIGLLRENSDIVLPDILLCC